MANLIRRGLITNAFAPRGKDGATLNLKKITDISAITSAYGSATTIPLTIEVDDGTGAQGGGGPVLFHPNPTISSIEDSTGTVTNFTQETTLTLSGTCVTDPDQVEVFDNGVTLGLATIDTSTTWSLTVTGLSYTSHTFYAVSTASDTTTKQSTDSVVLVDEPMVAPVISQIVTANETVYATGQTITAPDLTISGTGQIGSAVELISSSSTLWSGTVDGSGNWSATLTGLSDGSVNTVFARTTDAYESVDSTSWTFTVALPPTTYQPGTSAYYPLTQASLYKVGRSSYYSNLTWDSINGTVTNTGTDGTACWQAADNIAYEAEIDAYLTVRWDMNFSAFTDHNVMLQKQTAADDDGWLASYSHSLNVMRIVTGSDGLGDNGQLDGSVNTSTQTFHDFSWTASLNTDYTFHVIFDVINDYVELFIDGVSLGTSSFQANGLSASITPLDILGAYRETNYFMGRTAQGTMSNLRFEPVKMTAAEVSLDQ